jgi:1-phosphofructokinase
MGKESEINARGPEITGEDMDALFGRLDGLAPEDFLVLAGSIPAGLPSDSYERILRRLKEKKVKAVVDAEKDLLVNALKYRPFLIKPNRDELGAIFGVKLKSGDEIIHYAKLLQKMGAENVLVSMAGDGAILAASDGRILRALPPSGKVVNSVGSGDSMVAGFLAGYLHTGDFENALKVGICAGSATAFSEWLAPPDRIEKLLKIM